MNIALTLGSFFLCTVLVAFIAWWRTRGMDNANSQDYFLAGRKLPWIQVAGALLLTNLSTEQLIGLNGAASIHGAVVMAWEVVPVFALIAMAWYFLPRYWSGNITTVPQFLEQRFDATARRIMGIVFIITIALNILPFVLYSGGVAMSTIFHVHTQLGISERASFQLMAWSIGIIGTCYVLFGGMKAVALSDTLYGAGLLVCGLLIPVLALFKLGEGEFFAGLTRVLQHQAVKIDPVGGARSNVPFDTLFTGMLFINLFYWCTNQMIVQRSFGAKSFAEAQKGILATAGLKLLGPFFLVIPGIIAAEMFGPAAIGNGDLAYSLLVDAVLPPYLVGLFAAIFLGAVISAFNGGLHSVSTMFSVDLYRGWLRPGASDHEMVRAGKIFSVAIVVVSILTSSLLGGSSEGIFTMMKQVMSAFKLPLLAVVVVGMISRRVPAWAANFAMVLGVFTSILLNSAFGDGFLGFRLKVSSLHVHWLHLAALNTILLCGFMLLIGRFAPARPAEARAGASAAPSGPVVDLTPWSGLRVASIVVALAAIGLYFALWRVAGAR
jgi:SSS family solute:Na+ symporter